MRIISTTNQYPNPILAFSVGISLTVLCFLFLSCGAPTQNEQGPIAELKHSGSGKTTVPGKSAKGPSSLPASAEIPEICCARWLKPSNHNDHRISMRLTQPQLAERIASRLFRTAIWMF